MSRKFKVVAVSGSVQRPSRTLVLVEQLLAALAEVLPIDVHLITLEELAPAIGGTSYRDQLPGRVQAELAAIESADVLVVGSPVYRGSYTGLFKHLFDLVHHEALIDVPVLLAATGGSDRHALVIDHQLRPLFSFFQARTLPLGVYASEQDFSGHEITSQALRDRIALAVARALPLLSASSADDLRTARVAQAA
ncbi:FMN reductase [Ralstonia pickettii]|uniref:FMN reductase n=1 Tax=Ralstonia pickettii TaxID=329 RepID=A0A7X2HPM8_RALPI|nr:FMN reductase [Ralstonia pickettii]MRT00347.1 FMN reductase [Ralstonia pickettii]